jgi:hypothetical protein
MKETETLQIYKASEIIENNQWFPEQLVLKNSEMQMSVNLQQIQTIVLITKKE